MKKESIYNKYPFISQKFQLQFFQLLQKTKFQLKNNEISTLKNFYQSFIQVISTQYQNQKMINPKLLFKQDPEMPAFQRNDGKLLTTLKLKNYSFIKIDPKEDNFNHNRISIQKNKFLKTSRQGRTPLPRYTHQQTRKAYHSHQNEIFDLNIHKYDEKIQNRIFGNKKYITQNVNRLVRLDNKIEKITPEKLQKQKKQHCQRIRHFFSLDVPKKQKDQDQKRQKTNKTTLEFQYNIKKEKKLKQKLSKSINLQNIYQKFEPQVTSPQKNQTFFKSPRAKARIQLAQKNKKNSNSPNFRARTVFDQFNLKFLIDKRKTFEQNNQHRISGSNTPYFQSFVSHEGKSPTKAHQSYDQSPQNQKLQRNVPEQRNWAVAKRKKESYVLIDSEGVIHQRSPEQYSEDPRQLINKMSGKLITVRKMLNFDRS